MIYSRFRSKVAGLFGRICTSRPKEKILEWAKRWIRLSSGESADFAGAYDDEIKMLSPDGSFSPKAVEVIRASLKDLGILDTVPDVKSLYVTDFVPVK